MKNNLRLSDDQQLGGAFALIGVIISLAYMHGDSTLTTPHLARLLSVPNYLCTLFIIIKLACKVKVRVRQLMLAVTVLLCLLFFSFHYYKEMSVSPLSFVPLFLFCISSPSSQYNAFKLYRLFLVLTSFIGIICYVSFVFSLRIPYSIVDYYSSYLDAYYIDYKISFIVLEGLNLRLCGMFNEPGYLGTVAALLLVADNFNMKRLGNIFVFIAAVLSFSLAFYLLVGIYFLFKVFKKKKYFLYFSLFMITGYFVLQYLAEEIDTIAEFLKRFSKEEGSIERTTDGFNSLYNQMFIQGDWFLGYGTGYLDGRDLASAGYKPVIIQHGVFGFLLLYGYLLYVSVVLSSRRKAILIFILIFFASIYQRATIFTLNYYIILFGGIEFIKRRLNTDLSK